ncbi:MAG: hypothetical protein Q7T20_00765 [Saprospiraceae bacterium]|nr:hypothetical protein [Saprospiraceae bacterium]
MTVTIEEKSIVLHYESLEKEWFSLVTKQQKAAFWEKMSTLLSELDQTKINLFFEQLYQSTKDVSERLELAKKRAELAGFKSQTA